MQFSIERKGYKKSDVDEHLRTQALNHARELQTLSMRIEELKAKVIGLEAETTEFKAKERNVNEALIAAIERAKEMDSTARIRYALEGERLKLFEAKWINFIKKTMINAKIKNEMEGFLQNANAEIGKSMEQHLNIPSRYAEPKPAKIISLSPAEKQYLSEKKRLESRVQASAPTLEEILNDFNY
jgi:hypothetical protein